MEIAVDTLWEAVDFEFEKDSTSTMAYLIKRPFKYDEQYRISVDSATLTSVYNHVNNPVKTQFTVKGEKDYGYLIFEVQGLPTVCEDTCRVMPAFIELLNSSGAPVRKAVVENGVAVFKDLTVDKYYARIILDANENGRWDAGNYAERRQPELVYYYLEQIETRLNWGDIKDWDVGQSVLGQKPSELVKNKPKEEMKKKRDYREENKPGKGSGMSPSIGGLRF